MICVRNKPPAPPCRPRARCTAPSVGVLAHSVCTNPSTKQWGPAAPSPHTGLSLPAASFRHVGAWHFAETGLLPGGTSLGHPSATQLLRVFGFSLFSGGFRKPVGTCAVPPVELAPPTWGPQAGGHVRPGPTPRAPGDELLRVTSRSRVSALCPRRGGGLRAAQQQAGQVQRDAVLEGEQVPAEQRAPAAAGLRAAQHRVVLRPGGLRG